MHQSSTLFTFTVKNNICDSSHKEYDVLLLLLHGFCAACIRCALCRPVSFKTRSNLGWRALAFTMFWLEPERWDWEKPTQQHIWSQTATRALSRHSDVRHLTRFRRIQVSGVPPRRLARSCMCHSSKWMEEDNVPFTSIGTNDQAESCTSYLHMHKQSNSTALTKSWRPQSFHY